MENCQIHYCADQVTITTVFRTITSVKKRSLHGAVAEMCEEYESYHAGRPVVGEQSSSSPVPNVINTNVLLNKMILHIEHNYCKDLENELKSYHNKTNQVNFEWMKDF